MGMSSGGRRNMPVTTISSNRTIKRLPSRLCHTKENVHVRRKGSAGSPRFLRRRIGISKRVTTRPVRQSTTTMIPTTSINSRPGNPNKSPLWVTQIVLKSETRGS